MGTAWLGHSRACTPLLPPLPQLGGGVVLGAASSCFPGCSHAALARAAASWGRNLPKTP